MASSCEILPSSSSFSSTDEADDIFLNCCSPTGCSVQSPVNLHQCVKLIASSEQCTCSLYMHNQCFEEFEDSVLQYLKLSGRARSWSEKQRRQNIWTKRGYDLSYKACTCKCTKGYLKKDFDFGLMEDDNSMVVVKTKRKKKKSNDKPLLILSTSPTNRSRTISGCSTSSESSVVNKCLTKEPVFSFARRSDYHAFLAALPKQKLNPYQIKMEDETYGGNYDEKRNFVLSNLASHKVHTVQCLLCLRSLPVFDRYPLIDGTFFLSVHKALKSSIDLVYNHCTRYLCAVCVGCVQGASAKVLCSYCNAEWKGDLYQLGTLYSYDIFAANPCCDSRMQCNTCSSVVDISSLSNSYSDFAQQLLCQTCGVLDYHLTKPHCSTFKLSTRQRLDTV